MGLSFWILSDKGVSASTRRLLAVAEARGHAARAVAPADIAFVLADRGSEALESVPDVVLARMGGGTERAAFDVLFAFEALGVCVVSPAAALLVARDKALSALAFRAADVPSPLGVWIAPAKLDEALAKIPGPPWIVKLPAGHQGDGVRLLRSEASLRAAVRDLSLLAPRILVQEHVPAAAISDLRVIVVRGAIVAAMERTAPPGDFRTNLHRGGSARAVTPSAAQSSLAIRAAASVGLDVAGVDIVQTSSGPKVLEINASPGLVGIERATGVDVAGAIVIAVEALALARGICAPATDEVDERDGVRA